MTQVPRPAQSSANVLTRLSLRSQGQVFSSTPNHVADMVQGDPLQVCVCCACYICPATCFDTMSASVTLA